MWSRPPLVCCLLWLLVCPVGTGLGQEPDAEASEQLPPPNLVVFLADDMGLGDTSAYQDWTGNPASKQVHTPAMETLARRGIRFTDAHSPHSRCTTSRYALLTGRYCWRTRLKHWVLFGVQGDPLIERERVTLPEFLQRAGYLTGMVGKWHLGLTYRRQDGAPADGWNDADLTQPLFDGPLDHGFDFFYGVSRSHGTSGPDGARDARNQPDQQVGPGWISGRHVVGATGRGKQLDGSYRLDEVGTVLDAQAFLFLQQAVESEKPFFLYFASPANHTPYTPSREIAGRPIRGASRYVDGSPTNSRRADFIYQNDVHLQRLMDYLATTPDPRRPDHPLLENTLLVFASDNGADRPDKTCTGPLRSNKASLYEGGHRVPLIAMWPAGKIGDNNPHTSGATSEALVGLNDLFATMAEVLGRPLPPLSGADRGAEDSVSFLAALQGRPTPRRVPLFPNDHKEASRQLSERRAWVAVRSNATPIPGQWKLLLDHRYAYQGELHAQELYELSRDLQETNNLVHDPAAAPALDFLLQAARQAAGDQGHSRP
ncbi:MAG: arylsulfatase [Pirellulaceae bacterium]|nr:MAG: arylsulfatase [Pirellulaceae bacterium]